MRYFYKNEPFNFGHYIFAWLGNFVHLLAIILRVLTFNLVWFKFELDFTIYSLKNQDKLDTKIKNFLKIKK